MVFLSQLFRGSPLPNEVIGDDDDGDDESLKGDFLTLAPPSAASPSSKLKHNHHSDYECRSSQVCNDMCLLLFLFLHFDGHELNLHVYSSDRSTRGGRSITLNPVVQRDSHSTSSRLSCLRIQIQTPTV